MFDRTVIPMQRPRVRLWNLENGSRQAIYDARATAEATKKPLTFDDAKKRREQAIGRCLRKGNAK